MIDYPLILTKKYPNTQWSLNGDSYEGLEWLDPSPKPTKEELDSQWEEVQFIQKKQQCKDQAKSLLAKTDWASLPDVQAQLTNASEFISYRSQLRELVINPVEAPVFPTEPEARWK